MPGWNVLREHETFTRTQTRQIKSNLSYFSAWNEQTKWCFNYILNSVIFPLIQVINRPCLFHFRVQQINWKLKLNIIGRCFPPTLHPRTQLFINLAYLLKLNKMYRIPFSTTKTTKGQQGSKKKKLKVEPMAKKDDGSLILIPNWHQCNLFKWVVLHKRWFGKFPHSNKTITVIFKISK